MRIIVLILDVPRSDIQTKIRTILRPEFVFGYGSIGIKAVSQLYMCTSQNWTSFVKPGMRLTNTLVAHAQPFAVFNRL
jgi:hypothetical protein